MKRMDPSFSEKPLGSKSFGDFLRSRRDLIDRDETSRTRVVRLHSDTASSCHHRDAPAGDRECAGE
jgi:hypothetical protein